MNLIDLQQVTKKFRAGGIETTSLSQVDFQRKQGDFIAVTGESGSGKTTLLNIIGMLDDMTSGLYLFGDVNVGQMSEKKLAKFRKEKVGYIFQNFNLVNGISVFDNIAMPLKYSGVGVKERKEKVIETAEKLGIAHRLNHLPIHLSGGQQQRVACARALVCNSELILADEPTGNLDHKTGTDVLELLQQINQQGTAILLVTHSKDHATFATEQRMMRDGKLLT